MKPKFFYTDRQESCRAITASANETDKTSEASVKYVKTASPVCFSSVGAQALITKLQVKDVHRPYVAQKGGMSGQK